jgi:2-(1,2-epoxy-1,2-dihydrophenyl)acetyl-CoA isomerase
LVGLARAMEIAAFDEPISARQALDWGLITKIVEDGDAKAQAIDMARQLARRSLHAFGTAKQLLTDSFSQTFETQMERERRGLAACAEHAEGREGLLAFIEKRKPVFQ